MRIRQVTLEAGPEGVVLPGREREVPDDVGQALITCGAAVEVAAAPVKVEVAEAAVEPPAAEAAIDPGRPKRKARA